MARVPKNKNCKRRLFKRKLQTTLNYDYENQEWIAYSSVPTHITRMTKLYGDDVEVLERLESLELRYWLGRNYLKAIGF